tara:strand:+ start:819 stop:2135 length:1317 start_codon:yes stop_codon:yes gene_type:complete
MTVDESGMQPQSTQPDTTKPGFSDGLQDFSSDLLSDNSFDVLGGIDEFGIGQNEYFSSRAKGRSRNLYQYESDLVYPIDLTEESETNRQSSYIRFQVFKRKSQRATVNFDDNPDGGFNFNAGLVDRQGNIEEGIDISGIDFSLSADAPDVNIISQDEKSSYTSYGRYGNLIGNRGVAFDPLKGELSRTNRFGNKTEVGPSANREIVNRVASDIRLSKATEKLEEQILMYVPSGLNFSDKVDYEEGSAGVFNAINEAISGNLGAGIDKLKLLGVEKLSSKAAKNIPTAGENDLQNFFRARLGFAENPKNESLFRGVGRKTFSLEFKFAPRNQRESIMMLNIIEAFRFHMLPELSVSSTMLLAPHEFDVSFFYRDLPSGEFVENINLPKIGRAFLTDLSVNYAPSERSTFFRDGVPTEVTLSLTMSQAVLLNRQLILAGF